MQSVKCLTADTGVLSLSPAWSHTFAEIDHEIIPTVILHSRRDSCQLQANVCARGTDKPLSQTVKLTVST